ncbi:protein FAM26D-like [Stegastes partitus]|uniref:Protein FAM26D-like n=1 Tax=Stegastes partitus TaxID=144197 RepID=A0A9Y4K4S1_9TELE|nr:PREDICTED: protein FAM26D-like [Stegastes partitus]
MEKVVTKFAHQRLGVYAAITMMFTYNVLLDRDFACSCKAQTYSCNCYLALPVVVIFVLMLWTNGPFHSVCRHICIRPYPVFSLVIHMCRALLVGLLWIAFVLIDGDWYVCCKNDLSDLLEHLPCTDQQKLTTEERVKIVDLKNKSRVWGSFLLLGIVCVAAFMSMFKFTTCCNPETLYQRLILEAEGNKLQEVLKEAAEQTLKDNVNRKINNGRWDEVCNVTETLMNEPPPRGQALDEQQDRNGAAERQEEQIELTPRAE